VLAEWRDTWQRGGWKLLCAGKRGRGIRQEDSLVCGQGSRDKGMLTRACGERCVWVSDVD